MKKTMMTATLVLALGLMVWPGQEASGGTLEAWGNNSHGECDVPAGSDFSAIAGGYLHSLALKADGSLAAWGDNGYSQCDVPAGNDFGAIAAGGIHNLALKSDGSLAAWGSNTYGQCDVPAGNDFAAIAAGGSHSLALKSDGSLASWGISDGSANDYGQVTDTPAGNDFIAVAARGYHSLALKSDGTLAAWGRNAEGQCDVPAGNNFVAIAAGSYHSLALKSDGSLAAWGRNDYGQSDEPAGNDFAAVAGGAFHSLALKSGGSLAAWGVSDGSSNDYGQVTDTPVGNDYAGIAAGSSHSLAIAASPMGMAFTYQGYLLDEGIPADGLYDFEFKLYNSNVAGLQKGITIDIDDLDVIDGHFAVELDFGPDIFTGDARWLETTVAQSNGSDPCTLSPRVELTPTPYALYAKTADSDNDWMVIGSDLYSIPDGNVGIGTTSPSYKLDVAGSLRADGLRTKPNATSTNLIGGHSGNSVTSGVVAATIGGGGDSTRPNKVTDNYGTVGGGGDNQAGDNGGTAIDATYATVGGGLGNNASVEFATVGGGYDNTAGLRLSDPPTEYALFEPSYATVGGGQGNSARGPWSTVGGGQGNTASELVPQGEAEMVYPSYTTVGGGGFNTAREYYSTVSGGFGNTAREPSSTVGGGGGNTAGGPASTVSGGYDNTAWGGSATVPGGSENAAGGGASYAAGYRAKANHDGTFVWADYTSADFASTGTNQFLIRASGGVGIGTNSPNEKLTVEGALSLGEISAPSSNAGYGKVYVKSADSKLYFKNDAGTEYKLSEDEDSFVAGNYLLNANDTERNTGSTGAVLLKETKIGRGGSLRIKFRLRSIFTGVTVFAQIYRNGTPVGTLRSLNVLGYIIYPEDISGWSKGDLVQIYGSTSNPAYHVFVSNFRLYVDNPAEAGAHPDR